MGTHLTDIHKIETRPARDSGGAAVLETSVFYLRGEHSDTRYGSIFALYRLLSGHGQSEGGRRRAAAAASRRAGHFTAWYYILEHAAAASPRLAISSVASTTYEFT